MDSQFPLTLVDLFKFIGTPLFIGFIVSFLLERVPWFQAQDANTKAIFAFTIAVVLPLISYALLNYVPQTLIDTLQPWYAAAVTGVIGFIGSQVWHKYFNQSGVIWYDDNEQLEE